MTPQQSLWKTALLEELSNGHFRLRKTEEPTGLVSEIEFNNRKAARNWARGRGYVVDEVAPNGETMGGAN